MPIKVMVRYRACGEAGDKQSHLEMRLESMRALILAAGMGTRLRPITETRPKTLVPVLGEPIIIRQIRFLRETGVDEITVVTGYLADRLAFLADDYGVRLIHNDKYDVYNNLYSLYVARDYLSDAYILEGDVYLARNFLIPTPDRSTYYTGIKSDFRKEWILEIDEQDRIQRISIGDGTAYIMSGVSYWTAKDCYTLSALLEQAVANSGFETMFWDDLIKDNLDRFVLTAHKISPDDWFEIDTVADLAAVEIRMLTME